MGLNDDFSRRVLVHADTVDWTASPMAGVERRMLDRIGDEVARATTIVRYAPDSHFSPHVHTGGEEFFVLEGVFQDEHGDFPAGSYVRNPPTSRHTPGPEAGCTIFVKLWQFDLSDRTQAMIDTNKTESIPDARRPGVSVMPLFMDTRETVSLETWDPDLTVTMDLPRGGEFLVLDGSFSEGSGTLRQQSWLRLPEGSTFNARAGDQGTRVWIKTGHIPDARAPRPAATPRPV